MAEHAAKVQEHNDNHDTLARQTDAAYERADRLNEVRYAASQAARAAAKTHRTLVVAANAEASSLRKGTVVA